MPVLINRHNVAHVVKDGEEGLHKRIEKQQLRYPHPEDWAWLNDSSMYFHCPWIWEHERGCFGDRPMLVTGGGECMHAEVDGAYRLLCNPRPESPKADGMCAIDSVFWQDALKGETTILIEKYPHHKDADFFFGPMGPPPPTRYGRDQFRFGIPVHPIKSMNGKEDPELGKYSITKGMRKHGITVRTGNAIKQVNICGIAAWLVARYLSTGPIILTGFPLRGNHIGGMSFDYKAAQYFKWEAVAAFMDNTWMHRECNGPLDEFFPKWEGN